MSRARDTANQINRVNSSAADATAITVDSSENVGIGTATPSGKLELYGSGISDLPLVINHAWGSSSTALISASAASSEVFKVERNGDLTLSGGVYLGGTGAANKLDDYETGTWTPILGGSTTTSGQSYATQHGSYTKIGRVVHLQGYVVVSSIGTTSGAYGQVQNLPFTAAPVQGYGGGFFQYFNQLGTNVSQLIAYAEGNTTFAYVLYTAGAGTVTNYLGGGGWGSAPQVMFSMTYLTNS